MSGGEWAALIAAGFFALGVVVLSLLVLNLFRLVSELGNLVRGVTDETVPLIGGLHETVSGINVELARVDAIVASVQSMSERADSMVGVVQATVANPLIKAAAYAAGAAGALRAARAVRD